MELDGIRSKWFSNISLRLLALILCSNCSIPSAEGMAALRPLGSSFFANRPVPCACVTPATDSLGISCAALTVHPPHLPHQHSRPKLPTCYNLVAVPHNSYQRDMRRCFSGVLNLHLALESPFLNYEIIPRCKLLLCGRRLLRVEALKNC